MMDINIRQIAGNWDLGYVLDKHTRSSVYLGENEFGRPIWDTTRSEVGECLYRLKYQQDWSKITPLATEIASSIVPRFDNVGLVVPMPASVNRTRQPVNEISQQLSKIIGVPAFENLLGKVATSLGDPQLKNLISKEEKSEALKGRFLLNKIISNEGSWNVLLIDDLFDTGASMEAACATLRSYSKIGKVYVAALTWK